MSQTISRRTALGTIISVVDASPIAALPRAQAATPAGRVDDLGRLSMERLDVAYDTCVAARDAINGIYSQPRVIGPADAAEHFVSDELQRFGFLIDRVFKIARAATPTDFKGREFRLEIMMRYAAGIDDPELNLQIARELAETYAGAVS